MFDIAWSHLAVIAVIGLVVIGPKDLPRVLRTVGVWVGKARAVAREFQSSLDQMVREAELDDIRKQVEQASSIDLKHEIERSIDPGREMERSLVAPATDPAPAAALPVAGESEMPPPALPSPEAESATAEPKPDAADRPA